MEETRLLFELSVCTGTCMGRVHTPVDREFEFVLKSLYSKYLGKNKRTERTYLRGVPSS